jgi:LPXTG-motif cell wall-anchored protein
MELLDTAVIDGEGNKNYSQFGVDYVEPFDTDYEFGTEENPGENPPDEPQQPEEKKDKDDATVFTYAIALKKVDPEGNELVGAKFKLRGVTVTEKSKGYYKVATYSHAATADFGTEIETDDHGVLVVEGLPTKWDVEIMETEAPAGFNKLTDTLTLKPFKTGEEVTTTATVTYKDIDGVKTSITTTTVEYKNASGTIAKKVTVGDADPVYYGADGTEITAANFNTAIAAYAAAEVDETTVTKNNDNVATIEVVNNAGAELPSTGGIGTTIFYVLGSILVICAGVVLVTRRRMSA